MARRAEVVTLVLSHLDLPLPGGAGRPGVDVDVDGVAEVGGWDEHVLAGVVAADGGGSPPPGIGHRQSVVPTVRRPGSVSGGNRGGKS